MVKLKVLGKTSDRVDFAWESDRHEALRAAGVDIVDANGDVTLVTYRWFEEQPLSFANWDAEQEFYEKFASDAGPFIFEDCSDHTTIFSTYWRSFLNHPNCLGYLCNAVYRDPKHQNDRVYDYDRIHTHTMELMSLAMPFTERVRHYQAVPFPLEDKALAKIKLAFPLKAVSENTAADTLCLQDRKYDVSFVGHLAHCIGKDPTAPTEDFCGTRVHRHRCYSAIRSLNVPERFLLETPVGWEPDWPPGQFRLANNQYARLLSNTKIAVCPWGWTAWTWRDVEAIMQGCVVVKPRCDEIRIHPDFYHKDSTWMRWCEPDFSDLQVIVDDILRQLHAEPEAMNAHHREVLPQRMLVESSHDIAREMFVSSIKECLR